MSPLPALMAGLLLATPLAAEDVHVVDASGGSGADFITIQAAIDAAAGGDIVLVRPGTYVEDVVIDGKSLTLIGDAASQEDVVVANLLVRNVGSGDAVAIRRLLLEGGSVIEAASLRIEDCEGAVWVEEVRVDGPPRPFVSGGVRTLNGRDVSFIRCTFNPAFNLSQATVHATWSKVQMFETTVIGRSGADGPLVTEAGEEAITLQSSQLYLYGSTVTGGRGGDGIGTCGPGSTGGDGIRMVESYPWVYRFESEVNGGAGGSATGSCVNGEAGTAYREVSPSSKLLDVPGRWRGFAVTSPVRDDGTMTAVYRGYPGDLVWVGIGMTPSARRKGKRYDGPLMLNPFPCIFVGVVDETCVLTQELRVQDLGPGVEGLHLFTQAFFWDGRFTMATPSMLTAVDASL